MQTIDVNKFLVSLTAALALRSGLVWVTDDQTVRRSLWLREVIDRKDYQIKPADPATALRPYGGPSPAGMIRRLCVSVQFMTRGTSAAAADSQAWLVHQAMLNDAGQPQNNWPIAGKILTTVGGVETVSDDPDQDWNVDLANPLQVPGSLGRDADSMKWMVSWNCDIDFRCVPKT